MKDAKNSCRLIKACRPVSQWGRVPDGGDRGDSTCPVLEDTVGLHPALLEMGAEQPEH